MKHVWTVLGMGLFLFVAVRYAAKYEREWEFGRYGLPVSALAADGRHYRDGAEVDPISLALVRSGREQTVEAVLLAVILGLNGCIALVLVHRHVRR